MELRHVEHKIEHRIEDLKQSVEIFRGIWSDMGWLKGINSIGYKIVNKKWFEAEDIARFAAIHLGLLEDGNSIIDNELHLVKDSIHHRVINRWRNVSNAEVDTCLCWRGY